MAGTAMAIACAISWTFLTVSYREVSITWPRDVHLMTHVFEESIVHQRRVPVFKLLLKNYILKLAYKIVGFRRVFKKSVLSVG